MAFYLFIFIGPVEALSLSLGAAPQEIEGSVSQDSRCEVDVGPFPD